MTAREGHASRVETTPRTAAKGRPSKAPSSHSSPSSNAEPTWDELFHSASPDQQRELLALASQQGLLYGHQLPALVDESPSDRACKLLNHLLTGRVDGLAPVRPGTVALHDSDLDDHQREAVAR